MSPHVAPMAAATASSRHPLLWVEDSHGQTDDDAADPQPVRPPEPAAEECCGEGCVPCVFDIYEQAMERYRLALAAWQARHPERDQRRGS